MEAAGSDPGKKTGSRQFQTGVRARPQQKLEKSATEFLKQVME